MKSSQSLRETSQPQRLKSKERGEERQELSRSSMGITVSEPRIIGRQKKEKALPMTRKEFIEEHKLRLSKDAIK